MKKLSIKRCLHFFHFSLKGFLLIDQQSILSRGSKLTKIRHYIITSTNNTNKYDLKNHFYLLTSSSVTNDLHLFRYLFIFLQHPLIPHKTRQVNASHSASCTRRRRPTNRCNITFLGRSITSPKIRPFESKISRTSQSVPHIFLSMRHFYS